MSLRSLARRLFVAAAAAVTLVAPLAHAEAQAITYSFSGRLPNFLGRQTFSLDLQGDVSNVIDLTSVFGLPTGTSLFATQAASGTATIGGSGPISLDAIFGAGSAYLLGSVNGLAALGAPFDNGVGFLGIGSNDLLFGLFLPTSVSYDLASNVGPLTGRAYGVIGSLSGGLDPSNIFALRATSFSATVTATPEPASIALMATGLVAIAGVAARRRKQRA